MVASISLDSGFNVGDPADFIVFGNKSASASFRSMKSTQELIYDAGHDRTTIFRGIVVAPSIFERERCSVPLEAFKITTQRKLSVPSADNFDLCSGTLDH